MEEPFGEAARYGPVLGFVLSRPLELVERGPGDAAGLEPPVTLGLATGAVGPPALFRDIEGARWIERRRVPVSLANADELDEGAVHGS